MIKEFLFQSRINSRRAVQRIKLILHEHDHVAETQLLLLVHPDQLLEYTQRRPSARQGHNESLTGLLFFTDLCRDLLRHGERAIIHRLIYAGWNLFQSG